MAKSDVIHVPVEPKLKQFLEREAREADTSVAAIVRVAIKKYFQARDGVK
jgi:hypothetical protein